MTSKAGPPRAAPPVRKATVAQKVPNTGALELIVLRNNFYRDNYRRLMLVCLGLILLVAGLGYWAFYERINQPLPKYFATTYDGKLIALKPLNESNLNDNQRVIIDLAYFNGYTQNEISIEMGIPLGTVKTRMRKAIVELRKILQPHN